MSHFVSVVSEQWVPQVNLVESIAMCLLQVPLHIAKERVSLNEWYQSLTPGGRRIYGFLNPEVRILRSYVPTMQTWLAVFNAIHSLAHPGPRRTKELIMSCFFWQRIGPDINHVARSCQTCEKNKAHRMSKLLYGRYVPPPDRFTDIAIDLMGHLPRSRGYSHIMVIVDRSSRYF